MLLLINNVHEKIWAMHLQRTGLHRRWAIIKIFTVRQFVENRNHRNSPESDASSPSVNVSDMNVPDLLKANEHKKNPNKTFLKYFNFTFKSQK